MNNIMENFVDVGEKYNFPVTERNNILILTAKNTDGKNVDWIRYNSTTDTVSHIGNTDQCNIWLCDTRKDFDVEKIIQFVKDLNIALNLDSEDKFAINELIDPEDWQVIASVHDAYKDNRYVRVRR